MAERRMSVNRRGSVMGGKSRVSDISRRASLALMNIAIRGLDPDEVEALLNMKKRKEILPDFPEEPLDNGVLIRFLRNYNFDVDKAVHGYLQYLEFRHEFEVNKIRFLPPPYDNAVSKYVTSMFQGVDNTGRPVLYESFTSVDFSTLVSTFSVKMMQNMLIYRNEKLLEACRRASRSAGQLVYDICYVIDLEGKFHIPEQEALTIHKELTHIDRWYYPHLYGRIVILNAPLTFDRSWRVNKRILPPETLKKIQIFSVDEVNKLTSIIDKDQIPERYGGRLPDTFRIGLDQPSAGISPRAKNYRGFGESKMRELTEEDSKYGDEGESKYGEPTRRLSAVNGLKTLSRRLSSSGHTSLFGFNS